VDIVATTLSQILRRFRPAVTPGPAGPAAVPVDRVAEVEAELAAVFAALEPAVTAAREVREQAAGDADRRRQQGEEEAERIVAAARARLDAVRAEAASAGLAALDAERAVLDADSRAEVERVRQVADERLAGLLSEVLAEVWATAGLSTATAADVGRFEVAR
jgi:hypothetical protein